jgi:hypothetical protein
VKAAVRPGSGHVVMCWGDSFSVPQLGHIFGTVSSIPDSILFVPEKWDTCLHSHTQ